MFGRSSLFFLQKACMYACRMRYIVNDVFDFDEKLLKLFKAVC